MTDICLSLSAPYLLRCGLPLNLEFTILAELAWPASEPQGPSCLYSAVLGI